MNKTRVITGIFMAIIGIPILILGGYFIYAGAIVFSFIGTYEIVKMHNSKHNYSKLLQFIIPIFSSLLVVLLMLYNTTNQFYSLKYFIFYLLLVSLFLFSLPLFIKEMKITDGFFYLSSILYAGCGIGLIASLRNTSFVCSTTYSIGSLDINLGGLIVFVYLLASTLLTDIGAYEVGIHFGKRKLIPDVSPNKTIEGAIGGSLSGTIFGSLILIIAFFVYDFKLVNIENNVLYIALVILTSLLITIVSQIGDLIASKLKREYGIKDYGAIFPGHGGVMDRFDSLIITTWGFIVLLIFLGVINL